MLPRRVFRGSPGVRDADWIVPGVPIVVRRISGVGSVPTVPEVSDVVPGVSVIQSVPFVRVILGL